MNERQVTRDLRIKFPNKAHELTLVEVFGQDTALHGELVANDEFISSRKPFYSLLSIVYDGSVVIDCFLLDQVHEL